MLLHTLHLVSKGSLANDFHEQRRARGTPISHFITNGIWDNAKMQNILSDSTIQHIKTIGIGKHDTEDKVFWDLPEKYSNKSTWSLITQETNRTQYCSGYSMQLLHSSQRVNQPNMFSFMERQLNMCGSTLEGHWESEFTTGRIKNQILPSTS